MIQFTTFGSARVNFIDLHPTIGVIFNGAVVHGRWNFNNVGDINWLFHYTGEESRIPVAERYAILDRPGHHRHQLLLMPRVWFNIDPQRASMLVEVHVMPRLQTAGTPAGPAPLPVHLGPFAPPQPPAPPVHMERLAALGRGG